MTTNQKRQDKGIESGKWGPVGGSLVGGEVLWEGVLWEVGSCGRWGPVRGGVL